MMLDPHASHLCHTLTAEKPYTVTAGLQRGLQKATVLVLLHSYLVRTGKCAPAHTGQPFLNLKLSGGGQVMKRKRFAWELDAESVQNDYAWEGAPAWGHDEEQHRCARENARQKRLVAEFEHENGMENCQSGIIRHDDTKQQGSSMRWSGGTGVGLEGVEGGQPVFHDPDQFSLWRKGWMWSSPQDDAHTNYQMQSDNSEDSDEHAGKTIGVVVDGIGYSCSEKRRDMSRHSYTGLPLSDRMVVLAMLHAHVSSQARCGHKQSASQAPTHSNTTSPLHIQMTREETSATSCVSGYGGEERKAGVQAMLASDAGAGTQEKLASVSSLPSISSLPSVSNLTVAWQQGRVALLSWIWSHRPPHVFRASVCGVSGDGGVGGACVEAGVDGHEDERDGHEEERLLEGSEQEKAQESQREVAQDSEQEAQGSEQEGRLASSLCLECRSEMRYCEMKFDGVEMGPQPLLKLSLSTNSVCRGAICLENTRSGSHTISVRAVHVCGRQVEAGGAKGRRTSYSIYGPWSRSTRLDVRQEDAGWRAPSKTRSSSYAQELPPSMTRSSNNAQEVQEGSRQEVRRLAGGRRGGRCGRLAARWIDTYTPQHLVDSYTAHDVERCARGLLAALAALGASNVSVEAQEPVGMLAMQERKAMHLEESIAMQRLQPRPEPTLPHPSDQEEEEEEGEEEGIVAREVARVRALHAQHAHHLMETQPLCHHLTPPTTHNALSGEMDEGRGGSRCPHAATCMPYQRHQRSEASIKERRSRSPIKEPSINERPTLIKESINERGTSIKESMTETIKQTPHDGVMGGCHTMTKYAWYAQEDCSDGSSSASSSASWSSSETGRGGGGGARVLLHVAVDSTLQLPAPTPPVHLLGASHVNGCIERVAGDGESLAAKAWLGESLAAAGDLGSLPAHHVAFLSEAGNPPEQREAGAEEGAAQERAHGGEERALQEEEDPHTAPHHSQQQASPPGSQEAAHDGAHQEAAAHQEPARGPAEAAPDDRQPSHTPPRKPCTASPNVTDVMLARDGQGYHDHERARRAMSGWSRTAPRHIHDQAAQQIHDLLKITSQCLSGEEGREMACEAEAEEMACEAAEKACAGEAHAMWSQPESAACTRQMPCGCCGAERLQAGLCGCRWETACEPESELPRIHEPESDMPCIPSSSFSPEPTESEI